MIGLRVAGNQTFYWPGKPLPYRVTVTDAEDGSLAKGTIAPDQVLVTLHPLDMGTDLTFAAQQGQKAVQTYLHPGLELINKSDCWSCHHPEEASVGPSYRKVALRYQQDKQAPETLAQKVIQGGNGNWGETAMSAHPQLTAEEAAQMVRYILSLAGNEAPQKPVPPQGIFTPSDSAGSYLVQVTYRDKGGPGVVPQVGQRQFLLRNAKVPAVACDDYQDVAKFNNAFVKFTRSGAYICYKNIDLTNLTRIAYAVSTRSPGRLELHLDRSDGPLVNQVDVSPTVGAPKSPDGSAGSPFGTPVAGKLKPAAGAHDLYVVYKDSGGTKADMWNSFDLAWIEFK